jgi:hypothetical protein
MGSGGGHQGESMASSERAGKLFYIEHHGVAGSSAAS